MNFVRKKQTAIVSFASTDLASSNQKLSNDLSGMITEGVTEVELRAPTALDIAWEPLTAIFHFAQGAQKSGIKVNWNFPEAVMSYLVQSGFESRE
ncbi:MAG: hypothetical protein JNM27_01240 [Leptospirales bacterium]|nr:hypothetical protein [Leptospirales bacterium]